VYYVTTALKLISIFILPPPRSAYFHSTTTLNYLRSLLTSGFASLHHPRHWSLNHVRSPSLRFVDLLCVRRWDILIPLKFADANLRRSWMGCRMPSILVVRSVSMQGWPMPTSVEAEEERWARLISIPGMRACCHTTWLICKPLPSHEGLMLDYETAVTCEMDVPPAVSLPPSSLDSSAGMRISTRLLFFFFISYIELVSGKRKAFYNTGAHFLWIGDRTRQLTGAHVEYFRGIRNPIGVKVGPSMEEEELVRLLDSKSFLCCVLFFVSLHVS